jgi:tRNA-2-methylthio-N6-dimethylallyladenosine synthase
VIIDPLNALAGKEGGLVGFYPMRQIKTFFLRTYGCQMNELDSEVMVGMLKRRGLVVVEQEEEADLLIFNTCWVRELAARKAMGKIGQLLAANGSDKIIGVTGCMANAKKERLLLQLPRIDFVIGTNNVHDLNTVLDEVLSGKPTVVRIDPIFREELEYTEAERTSRVKANVSIIRGCDKRCTYCCVPFTRGPEVSRDPHSIEEECRRLAAAGYKEIQLLGQNVNSYGKDRPELNCRFHDLLYRLAKIDSIERIRFMTSHPIDITRELMEAIRDLPSVCEFVHFPIQSGSDRILRKMHRIYTLSRYLETVALLREIVPGVALGTDIIVGFPTESEEDFERTVEVMRDIRYSVAFLFAYSPRGRTPAKRWRDDVPEEVKAARLQRLLALHRAITSSQRHATIGSEVEVLVERSNREPGSMKGRTRCMQKVAFPGDEGLIGTLQKVRVTGYSHETLLGERLSTGLPMLRTA